MKFKNSVLYEATVSVLPVTLFILIINFCLPGGGLKKFDLIGFIFGNVLLIAGMALYGKGTKISLLPIGDTFGSFITMKKKVWLLIVAGLLLGFLITVAEPSLNVLGGQLGSFKWIIIITIALGVGVFLAIALLLPLLKWDFSVTVRIMYFLLFVIALFVSKKYIPLCFDSGGVTTGALTVPFILALSASVAGTFGGKKRDENSFGMIALCSIGPIITTLLFCAVMRPEIPGAIKPSSSGSFPELLSLYGINAAKCFKEVLIALSPVALLFYIFNAIAFRLPKMQIIRITAGLVYTYTGLALFLTGVNAAYMNMGYFIGENLAKANKWLLLPLSCGMGLLIALAEPAVGVLVKQVENISGGTIRKNTMKIALAVSMGCALLISFIRVVTGISIWWFIGIGYLLAVILSFFVPKVYVSIAFDSGGVASGPMTATFLLPFAIGATRMIHGPDGILLSAYGLVAIVALMPLITVQTAGLIVVIREKIKKRRLAKKAKLIKKPDVGDIIELG